MGASGNVAGPLDIFFETELHGRSLPRFRDAVAVGPAPPRPVAGGSGEGSSERKKSQREDGGGGRKSGSHDAGIEAGECVSCKHARALRFGVFDRGLRRRYLGKRPSPPCR